jgi:cardiolipin synthase
MYKTSCVSEIESDFQETLKKCSQVTPDSIKNEKIFYKAAGAIMKILAPLM